MRVFFLAVAAVAALTGPAAAGVYGDDLGRCLVSKTPEDQQMIFLAFTAVAMAQHPSVQPYTQASTAHLEELQGKAAKVLEVAMTETCRSESLAAFRFEGPIAVSTALQTFGMAAMRNLTLHPAVAEAFEGTSGKIDTSKFDALVKEASQR